MASSSTPIHRVRFVDYEPSPITSLSFTPLPLPSADPKQKTSSTSSAKSEFGALVVARQNGQVDIWEWASTETQEAQGKGRGICGGWVLDRVLPAALSHPSISLMLLAIRDPESFAQPDSKRRVPTLAECRLFTAGTEGGDLVERCLFTGRVLQTYPVPAAPIWAISISPNHSTICIASSSTSLHLVSLNPYTPDLELAQPIHRTEALPSKTRTLSISWGPPARVQKALDGDAGSSGTEQGEGEQALRWEWQNNYLITGNSDGSARKWNLATGRMLSRLKVSTPRKDSGRDRSTIVWSTAVLNDHTIITTDSLGFVTFWDGRSLAVVQTFQAHKADAQCLVIGPSGRTVYASGPDQKVSEFTLLKGQNQGERWIHTISKRLHVHDVRTLAIWPPYSSAPGSGSSKASQTLNPGFSPILASGGIDMQVNLTPVPSPDQLLLTDPPLRNPILSTPVRPFADAHQKGLGFVPLSMDDNLLSFSPRKRLIMLRRYRGLAIWRLARLEELEDVLNNGYEKVLEMKLEVRTQLISSAISRDGRWLAVSDLYETKLFRLIECEQGGVGGELKPKRIKTLTSALVDSSPQVPFELRGTGSSTLSFSPDSNSLIMGLSMANFVVVVQLPGGAVTKGEEGLRVVKAFGLRGGESGRVIRDLPKRAREATNGHGNGVNGNGNVNGNADSMAVDEEMVEGDESISSTPGGNDQSSSSSDISDDEDEDGDSDAMSVDGESSHVGSNNSEREWRGRARMSLVSEDGEWMAVVTNGGKIMVFGLDVMKLHCVLPSFGLRPSTIAFLTPSILVLGFSIGTPLQAYDIENRCLLEGLFPYHNSMRNQSEGLSGLFSGTGSGGLVGEGTGKGKGKGKMIGWGGGWLGSVQPVEEETGRNRKHKRALVGEDSHLPNGTHSDRELDTDQVSDDEDIGNKHRNRPRVIINNKFKSILGVGRIGEGAGQGGELVVVERPFGDLRGLPMAFAEKKYGS